MKRTLLLFSFAFLAQSAFAQMQVIYLSPDGKTAHLALDTKKTYQLGEVINFYKNNKHVSQGVITQLTPRKTKAAVKLTRGAKFQDGLLAYQRPTLDNTRQVAQKKAAPEKKSIAQKKTQAERAPASISNTVRSSIPSSRSMSSTQDPLYFPEEKSFLLNLEGGHAQRSTKYDGLTETKLSANGFVPTLYYAPINNFTVGFGLGYISQTLKTGSTSDSASGITDPSLHFAYKILSDGEDALQFVAVLEVSPSIGKSEDNNVLRGNHLIRAGTFLGKRHGSFSWSVLPNLAYYTETKADPSSEDMDAYFRFSVDGEIQYDFNQRWAIYAPLLISYTGEQVASDASFKVNGYASLGAGAGFKFAPSNELNIYFDLTYTLSPSLKVEAGTTQYDGDQSLFGVTLGSNFKF